MTSCRWKYPSTSEYFSVTGVCRIDENISTAMSISSRKVESQMPMPLDFLFKSDSLLSNHCAPKARRTAARDYFS